VAQYKRLLLDYDVLRISSGLTAIALFIKEGVLVGGRRFFQHFA